MACRFSLLLLAVLASALASTGDSSHKEDPDNCLFWLSALGPSEQKLLKALHPYLEESPNVIDSQGRPQLVLGVQGQRIKESLPAVYDAGAKAGLSHESVSDILSTLLRTQTDPMLHGHDVGGHDLPLLENLFKTAAEENLNLQAEVPRLRKLIADMAPNGLQGPALYNLSFALRAGLTINQAGEVFRKISENEAGMGGYVFQTLQETLKACESWQVKPETVYRALMASLQSPHMSGLFHEIPGLIEMDVLKSGHDSNALLNELASFKGNSTEFLDHFDQLAVRITNEANQKALASPASENLTSVAGFPVVQGKIRHSFLPYRLERSYDAGMGDLLRLAGQRGMETEGAFVYSPKFKS